MFSVKEMAFDILGLTSSPIQHHTQVEPIWADLNGGMGRLTDLAEIFTNIRSGLHRKADFRRAVTRDNAADYKVIHVSNPVVPSRSCPIYVV
jgi:fatty acid synthase subunit beta